MSSKEVQTRALSEFPKLRQQVAMAVSCPFDNTTRDANGLVTCFARATYRYIYSFFPAFRAPSFIYIFTQTHHFPLPQLVQAVTGLYNRPGNCIFFLDVLVSLYRMDCYKSTNSDNICHSVSPQLHLGSFSDLCQDHPLFPQPFLRVREHPTKSPARILAKVFPWLKA